MNISPAQLRRLQTLWGLFCRQAQLDAGDRAARLEWVGKQIGRAIESFRDLTASEANSAIDTIQNLLPSEMVVKTRPRRRLAHAYGTAGRRGQTTNEIALVDHATLELLNGLLAQVGWTKDHLDSFLRSKRSPVRSGAIRTLAEANRVIWVLKAMVRRQRAA